MAGMTGAPVSTRGTERFNKSVGYAGGAENNPNFWATDDDYNQYQASLSGAPAPLPKGMAPGTFGAGITGNVQSVNPNGDVNQVQTTPYAQTNLFQTNPAGTAVAGQGSLTQPGFENQQQTQLESQLALQQATQGGDLKSKQMEQAARLQAQAEARRLGYLSTITGQQSPQVGPQAGPAGDEMAARAAAFARAKEQAGQTALASLQSLQDVMSESGKTGSSIESQGIQNIIGGGSGAINNFTRTQLMNDLNRAAEVGDRNQQNAITQRGQNLSLIPSLMGLITATGGAY